MSESTAEKQFAPTPNRVEEARKKGQIPIGRDLLTAAGYAGLTLALFALPERFGNVATELSKVLEMQNEVYLNSSAPDGDSKPDFRSILVSILPFFLLPATLVITGLIAQKALVFSGDRVTPKLSRLSLVNNARKKFGLFGQVEFLKTAVKIILLGAVSCSYLIWRSDYILTSSALEQRQILTLLWRFIAEFLLILTLLQGGIGIIDLLWQRYDHQKQLRMTRQEVIDDTKSNEGDPHIKSRRKQKAEKISSQQMLAGVRNADVVIVNPTHYAVALKWNHGSNNAPVCVAKGVDEIAARIREKAAEHGIAIRRDPTTARAIYHTVPLGSQIRREHFRAAASAIRFSQRLRNTKKRKAGR